MPSATAKKTTFFNSVYVNQFDKGKKCATHGHATENVFEKLAMAHGYKVRKATRDEQISHIDFILDSPEWQNIKVDVKGRKKTSRQNKKFNDKWVWIEFRNVQGKEGWIYGKANFIAFERKDYYQSGNTSKLARKVQCSVGSAHSKKLMGIKI